MIIIIFTFIIYLFVYSWPVKITKKPKAKNETETNITNPWLPRFLFLTWIAWQIFQKTKISYPLMRTRTYQTLTWRQFLVTESLLKMMKNAFYFTLKSPFILEVFRFLFLLFGHVRKRLVKGTLMQIWESPYKSVFT